MKKFSITLRNIIISLLVGISFAVNADDVDVYGVPSNEKERILNKFTPQVLAYMQDERQLFRDLLNKKDTSVNTARVKKEYSALAKQIQNYGKFAYVALEVVHYFNGRPSICTIEVVRSQDKSRLAYISPPQKVVRPAHQDLITKMQDFIPKGMKLAEEKQIEALNYVPTCPVYHCLFAFNHPQLAPYLQVFNRGARDEKALILRTLQHDSDAERRAAAAFLVGHFQDPKFIVATLLKYINDKDASVRNNSLRVISSTVTKAPGIALDPLPLLKLLDSPYDTDRNKALLVLFAIADTPGVKKQIVKYGKQGLLANLMTKQPNNRDAAYNVLHKVSKLNLKIDDLQGWERWFDKQQKVYA